MNPFNIIIIGWLIWFAGQLHYFYNDWQERHVLSRWTWAAEIADFVGINCLFYFAYLLGQAIMEIIGVLVKAGAI